MKSAATNLATLRRVPETHTFDGTGYVRRLMTELSRAEICRRIASARVEAGLTQPELGEALRPPVHWRTIQTWERGEKLRDGSHRWTVPWNHLDEIAEITGTTKEHLLHGDQPALAPSADASMMTDIQERLARIEQLVEQLLAQGAPGNRKSR